MAEDSTLGTSDDSTVIRIAAEDKVTPTLDEIRRELARFQESVSQSRERGFASRDEMRQIREYERTAVEALRRVRREQSRGHTERMEDLREHLSKAKQIDDPDERRRQVDIIQQQISDARREHRAAVRQLEDLSESQHAVSTQAGGLGPGGGGGGGGFLSRTATWAAGGVAAGMGFSGMMSLAGMIGGSIETWREAAIEMARLQALTRGLSDDTLTYAGNLGYTQAQVRAMAFSLAELRGSAQGTERVLETGRYTGIDPSRLLPMELAARMGGGLDTLAARRVLLGGAMAGGVSAEGAWGRLPEYAAGLAQLGGMGASAALEGRSMAQDNALLASIMAMDPSMPVGTAVGALGGLQGGLQGNDLLIMELMRGGMSYQDAYTQAQRGIFGTGSRQNVEAALAQSRRMSGGNQWMQARYLKEFYGVSNFDMAMRMSGDPDWLLTEEAAQQMAPGDEDIRRRAEQFVSGPETRDVTRERFMLQFGEKVGPAAYAVQNFLYGLGADALGAENPKEAMAMIQERFNNLSPEDMRKAGIDPAAFYGIMAMAALPTAAALGGVAEGSGIPGWLLAGAGLGMYGEFLAPERGKGPWWMNALSSLGMKRRGTDKFQSQLYLDHQQRQQETLMEGMTDEEREEFLEKDKAMNRLLSMGTMAGGPALGNSLVSLVEGFFGRQDRVLDVQERHAQALERIADQLTTRPGEGPSGIEPLNQGTSHTRPNNPKN